MKKEIKIISILLAVFLCFASGMFVYATGAGTTSIGSAVNGSDLVTSGSGISDSGTSGTGVTEDKGISQETQTSQQNLENQNGSTSGSSNNDGSGNADVSEETSGLMAQTCTSLKEQLSGLENSSNELENQYQMALKLQNESEAQLLKERLQIMEQEKVQYAKQLDQVRMELRETVRASYTDEEMESIKAVAMGLMQKYPNDRILPVENIIPLGFSFKFDTPPVVREGRTLIPVRALVEGMGAVVTWNRDDGTVIIEKEGMKIKLQLRSRTAYINGEEMSIDVPPETINNRTVVPLRFIMQYFNYGVEWDNENGLIEISSPEI